MIINVSKTQTSAFSTINEALEEAKKYIGEPITIKIDDGIYKEYIEIHQPDITFVGNDANKTILTFDNYAKFIMPDGEKKGTFRSMSVFINAPRFSAYNITFENNSGPGDTVGQALAAYIDSDCSKFVHCRFLGSQDTIFTAPLPPTAKEKMDLGDQKNSNLETIRDNIFLSAILKVVLILFLEVELHILTIVKSFVKMKAKRSTVIVQLHLHLKVFLLDMSFQNANLQVTVQPKVVT